MIHSASPLDFDNWRRAHGWTNVFKNSDHYCGSALRIKKLMLFQDEREKKLIETSDNFPGASVRLF